MKIFGMVFIAVMSLIFVGCSRADYVKPGATEAQIVLAEKDCQQEAKQRVHYASGLSQKFARDSYTIDCMEGKGIYKRWKYDELKSKGKLGQPLRIDTLSSACYQGDTIACYEAGRHYSKQEIRLVGGAGQAKAVSLFKKGCESPAPNKSAKMRAKNLCCKHYDILR